MRTPKLDFKRVLFLLFLFLGFLEAGLTGLVAGFFFWAVPSVLLTLSLIPFAGYFIYDAFKTPLLDNIKHFIPDTVLTEKVAMFFDLQAIIYCILTSALAVAAIVLVIFFWKRRQKKKAVALEFQSLKETTLAMGWKDLEDLVNKLKDKLKGVNPHLAGSVLFWLGIGVASHDFYWEANEWQVNTKRPTHGVYLGLGLATTGTTIIEPSVVKNAFFYLGEALCLIGFWTLSLLPRGVSRWISHFFWWSGTGLMIWNWYIHVKPELINDTEKAKVFT
jgi:hypothetical protein